MEKKDILYYIQKILKGSARPDEREKVDRHFQEVFQSEEWDQEQYGDEDKTYRQIYSSVNAHIDSENKPNRYARKLFVRYAASIAMVVGIGVCSYYYLRNNSPQDVDLHTSATADVLQPGLDIASLEFEDGTLLDLNSIPVGDELQHDGVSVIKTEDGNIKYVLHDRNVSAQEKPEWHSLTTPIGGKYQVMLADGTKVWLNAASSIRFPSRFDSDERLVAVSGEAYFEVAHDETTPFVVRVADAEVKVLGTSFNVSSYPRKERKAASSVALIEGSVQLTAKTNDSKILTPGQKAVLHEGRISIGAFDMESEIAWKNNYFIFKDRNIQDIMTDLARWYDAEIVYSGTNWHDKNFTIRMSRRQNMEEILSILELTGSVAFKIEGRRVTVLSK